MGGAEGRIRDMTFTFMNDGTDAHKQRLIRAYQDYVTEAKKSGGKIDVFEFLTE